MTTAMSAPARVPTMAEVARFFMGIWLGESADQVQLQQRFFAASQLAVPALHLSFA
jgi:hypothetical protein